MLDDTTTETQGQTPDVTVPTGQTPNSPSQTAKGTPHQQQTPLETLPPDIQDYIARLRSEAEEANKTKKAIAREKQAAEEARLYEQGEFRALAEKHENRVKELEPISESYAALSAQVNKQINADIKDWPDEVKSLDPGKEAPVETRLAWVAKARSIVEKMTEQQANRANARGASPSPRPQGVGGDIPQADLVKAMRGSGKYGL